MYAPAMIALTVATGSVAGCSDSLRDSRAPSISTIEHSLPQTSSVSDSIVITVPTPDSVPSGDVDARWVDAVAAGAELTRKRESLAELDRIDVVERFARVLPEGALPEG